MFVTFRNEAREQRVLTPVALQVNPSLLSGMDGLALNA